LSSNISDGSLGDVTTRGKKKEGSTRQREEEELGGIGGSANNTLHGGKYRGSSNATTMNYNQTLEGKGEIHTDKVG
jgi:hypothetical protein